MQIGRVHPLGILSTFSITCLFVPTRYQSLLKPGQANYEQKDRNHIKQCGVCTTEHHGLGNGQQLQGVAKPDVLARFS